MMSHKKSSPKKIADYVGILSSLLCLAHCLLVPFAVIGGGFMVQWNDRHDEHLPVNDLWTDYGWHILFILLAFWAIYRSVTTTPKTYIKLLLLLGWVLLVVGTWDWHFLMHIGSLMLIVGHLFNLRKVCLPSEVKNSTCKRCVNV